MKWHVPLAHYLEAGATAGAADGSYVAVQPMILPLFGGWSETRCAREVLAGLPKPTGPELVQETFKQIAKPADFVAAWAKFLHDGFLAGSAAEARAAHVQCGGGRRTAGEQIAERRRATDDFEVVFTACPKVDDGRYANNGWLQELPDPITKLTWDNAALISPATARS